MTQLNAPSSPSSVSHWTEIPGWFDYEDLYDLAIQLAADGDVFVELGVYLGRSAAYMAQKIRESGKQIRFYVVDLWGADPRNDGACPRYDSIYEEFLENMRRCGVLDVMIPIRAATVDAAAMLPDDLAFVFIDANHSYQAVAADIRTYFPKVRVGGILAGHDYSLAGVQRAVHELLSPIHVARSSWINTKLEPTSIGSIPINDRDFEGILVYGNQKAVAETHHRFAPLVLSEEESVRELLNKVNFAVDSGVPFSLVSLGAVEINVLRSVGETLPAREALKHELERAGVREEDLPTASLLIRRALSACDLIAVDDTRLDEPPTVSSFARWGPAAAALEQLGFPHPPYLSSAAITLAALRGKRLGLIGQNAHSLGASIERNSGVTFTCLISVPADTTAALAERSGLEARLSAAATDTDIFLLCGGVVAKSFANEIRDRWQRSAIDLGDAISELFSPE